MTSMMSSPDRGGAATEEHAEIRVIEEGDPPQNPFEQAKVTLNALSAAFDGLHGQTMQVDLANGRQIGDTTDLRRDAQAQQMRHENGIAEIQAIIDELLSKQVLGRVRDQVEKDIASQIDDIVKAQILACLEDHIPKDLQQEVEDSKQELERARLSLHNTESRRLNGKLRSNKPDEPLDTILMSNGSVSDNFPKDLRALFNLDADACKAIASDYDFPQVSDSHEKNLNKIMQFVGVRYQLVKNAGELLIGRSKPTENGQKTKQETAEKKAAVKANDTVA